MLSSLPSNQSVHAPSPANPASYTGGIETIKNKQYSIGIHVGQGRQLYDPLTPFSTNSHPATCPPE